MIDIIQATDLSAETVKLLNERFRVHKMPADAAGQKALFAEHGGTIRGMATSGHGPVTAEHLAALPKLEIISCYSAGLDGIDTATAAARGIPVFNTSHVLDDDVADIAIGLMLCAWRGLVAGDAFVRSGAWLKGNMPLGRTLKGAKLGVVGLGHLGKATVERAQAMKMEAAYHGPRRKADIDLAYYPDLVKLAEWSDILLISCPATPETIKLINRPVLDALGPKGLLVNIARGTIVDEAALVAALAEGRLGSAALDVFADEPKVPAELIANQKLVLLPHIGSATNETRSGMGKALVDRLAEHFGVAKTS